jgi:hypothetical protein
LFIFDYLRSLDLAKFIFYFYFIGLIFDISFWINNFLEEDFIRSWRMIWLLLFYLEDFMEILFIFLFDYWHFPFGFYEIFKPFRLFIFIWGEMLLNLYFWDLLFVFFTFSLFYYPIFSIFMINFQEAFVLSLFVLIIFFCSWDLRLLLSVP